uniref:Uncharacterized protein n=1 Tax=Anguilla anguilla TaxID=7936 RepID=A0A0E9P7P9_ANGAN
MRYRERGKE